MGSVLVLAECGDLNGSLIGDAAYRPTCELLTVARRIGEPIAVCCGPCDAADTELLARYGATRVFTVAGEITVSFGL